jgi:hypothetical protein
MRADLCDRRNAGGERASDSADNIESQIHPFEGQPFARLKRQARPGLLDDRDDTTSG